MAKIKKTLRDDPEPWEPPNNYWEYSWDPVITKKQFEELDPNIRTGLRNFKIQNIHSQGRYGIWPDWNLMPDYMKSMYGGLLTEKGHSYKNDWNLYRSYVRCANYRYLYMETGGDIIDPGERNKIYGLPRVFFEWWDHYKQEEIWGRFSILPNGSPFGGPVDIRPAEMNRSQSWQWDGMRVTIDVHGYEEYIYAKVSPVCRTIKSKKV